MARREQLFRREGEYWCVTFGGHASHLRDSKGLRYIARLIADPGRELHVLDLVAMAGDEELGGAGAAGAIAAGDAGELLDDRARAAYRRRLSEIEEDIAEAEASADSERAAQAEAERDVLLRELSRAVGLGGRSRRSGVAAERARSAVTRAVRHAIGRVQAHHAPLGAHLQAAVRTGTYCAYEPDRSTIGGAGRRAARATGP